MVRFLGMLEGGDDIRQNPDDILQVSQLMMIRIQEATVRFSIFRGNRPFVLTERTGAELLHNLQQLSESPDSDPVTVMVLWGLVIALVLSGVIIVAATIAIRQYRIREENRQDPEGDEPGIFTVLDEREAIEQELNNFPVLQKKWQFRVRKVLRRARQRLFRTKVHQDIHTLSPDLREQLKQIYVY